MACVINPDRMAVIRKSAEEAIKEKFAMKIGMDRTYFASVELGKRNVSIVNIEKIANGLGVSLSELFQNI